MSAISHVHARQVLDSRGNPTVEVEVVLESGAPVARSSRRAPRPECTRRSSCATAAPPYGGKGVAKAVANVNGEIADAIRRLDAADQEALDRRLIELDGTPNKGRLGANAILGVSLATAKAAAADAGVSLFRHLGGEDATTLPVPMLNVINGGVHADNSIDLQEFMVVPAGADSFSEALRIAAETYHELKKLLGERGLSTGGRRRGRLRAGPSDRARSRSRRSSKRPSGRAIATESAIALDPASSEFFSDGRYRFEGRELAPEEMAGFYGDLADRFPLVSLEDGNAEDDWDGWRATTERLGDRLQLVGDDIFVTNPERLRLGIERGVANSILVKVNQIGTLTETIEAVRLAHDERLHGGHVPPLGRDGGRDDRRPRGRARHRPDQDGRTGEQRPRREVQPAAPHRGGAGSRAMYPGWDAFPRARR